jgi:hypothetical protein
VQSKINLLFSGLEERNKVDSGLLDRPEEGCGQTWLSKSTNNIEKLCRMKIILWTNENESITQEITIYQ